MAPAKAKKKTTAKAPSKTAKPAAKPAAKAAAKPAASPVSKSGLKPSVKPVAKAAPAKPAAVKAVSLPLEADMSAPEQIAFSLSRAAIQLDHARHNGSDKKSIAHALDENLELWTGIRTVVNTWAQGVSDDTKANLRRLSDFVTGSIMKSGVSIRPSTVDTLININLQIAEGLLEGHASALVRQRAYEIWESEGRPHGRDFEHWNRAEREITKLMGRS